ncbi:MAG: PEP-CTERM sorting domain-containing protein, partial [Desulfobulbaceae bacterium]|nr:PEP-CTERM sorting domain-containing protein [Desulfobulbaceae bacterium]
VWEWLESPFSADDYQAGSVRGRRGAAFNYGDYALESYDRHSGEPYGEHHTIGFRVASNVPEPCSLVLLSLGGLTIARCRRR